MGFILGLSGVAGAGKDTVADYLIETHGWDAKISFAANLKDLCMRLFGLSEFDVNDQAGKRRLFSSPITFTDTHFGAVLAWMCRTHGEIHPLLGAFEQAKSRIGEKLVSPRHVLQFVGTDICREISPTYHVDVLESSVLSLRDKKVIVTDVRFPNEGEVILDRLGGLVVELIRSPRVGVNINSNHPSETAIRGWSKLSDTIDNQRDGLEFLYREVDLFLRKHSLCPIR